jgi:hypothetical protein
MERKGEISTNSCFVELQSVFETDDASCEFGTFACKTETHIAGKHSKRVNEFPYMHNWPILHAMLMTIAQRILHKCSNLLLDG